MLEVCSRVSSLCNYFNMYQSVHFKEAELGLQYLGTRFTKAVTIILGGYRCVFPVKMLEYPVLEVAFFVSFLETRL